MISANDSSGIQNAKCSLSQFSFQHCLHNDFRLKWNSVQLLGNEEISFPVWQSRCLISSLLPLCHTPITTFRSVCGISSRVLYYTLCYLSVKFTGRTNLQRLSKFRGKCIYIQLTQACKAK